MDKKFILALLIVVIFFGGIFYMQSKRTTEGLTNMKAAYQSEDYITGALIEIAEERGYFRQQNLKVETDTSIHSMNVALEKGEVDIQVSSVGAPLVSFYNNEDIVILGKILDAPPYHGVITKEGDLRGKNKAAVVKLGGLVQIYTEVVAENLGIYKEIEYSVAPIGVPQIAALNKGEVDFVVANIYNDDFGKIASDSKLKIISPEEAWGDKKSPTGILSTRKRIEKDESSVKGFIAAINRAQRYALSSPSELREKISNLYGYSDETSQKITDAYLRTASQSYELREEDFSDVVKYVKEFSPQRPGRPLSEFIDNRLIRDIDQLR